VFVDLLSGEARAEWDGQSPQILIPPGRTPPEITPRENPPRVIPRGEQQIENLKSDAIPYI